MITPDMPDCYPPPSAPMSPASNSLAQKILWFLLALFTTVILAMGGAWANSIERAQERTESRLTVVEQNYGTVVAQLQDLRDQNRDMSKKLDTLLTRGR